MLERVVLFDLTGCSITQFAVQALFVGPRDPRTGRDFKIIESFPVTTVVGEDGRIAVQFGLEDPHHGFSHCVVKGITDGPN